MEAIQFLFAGVAMGSIVLIIGKLVSDYRKLLSAKILIALMVCAIGYILSQVLSAPAGLLYILQLMGASISPLFWLFAITFFSMKEEPVKLNQIHYLIFAFCTLLSVILCSYINGGEESIQRDLVIYTNFAIKTLLVVLGLFAVVSNWAVDLVECRRRCRAGIIGTSGVIVIFAMMTEVIFDGETMPEIVTLFTLSLIAMLSMLKAYWMLISSPDGFLLAVEQPVETPRLNSKESDQLDFVDQQWLESLNACMEKEQYYRNNDLTIRSLSMHLDIPEHHLRRLINQHLGYRNFNDYLNRFRIKEASQRLLDPANSRLPITTIALESGYTSLTTFNKAFKNINEITPSEYRRVITE